MIDSMGGGVRSTSRRTFLLGAGAAAAGGAAMLVVGGTPAHGRRGDAFGCRRSTRRAAAFPPAGLTGDLAVAAVAASLENLAVFAYAAGLSAATAGKLGAVPPAVATFATTVKGQHQQHADAWNGVLKSQRQGCGHGDQPEADADGPGRLRQGDRHHRAGPVGPHARDDCRADLPGGDVDAEVHGGHRAVLVDPAGRDAAHRHPVLRARACTPVPRPPRARRLRSTRPPRRS